MGDEMTVALASDRFAAHVANMRCDTLPAEAGAEREGGVSGRDLIAGLASQSVRGQVVFNCAHFQKTRTV